LFVLALEFDEWLPLHQGFERSKGVRLQQELSGASTAGELTFVWHRNLLPRLHARQRDVPVMHE